MGSQAFDLGTSVPVRTLLRNAVVTKLSPLLKSNGLYLLAVGKVAKAWSGEHDDQGLSLLNQALQGRYPSILVALGDGTYDEVSMDALDLREEITVSVYVASANPRGFDDGRLSPDVASNADITADPGIDAMLQHALERLQGQDLGVAGIYEPRVHAANHVFTGEQFSCWELVFRVKVDVHVNPDRAITTIADSIDTKTEDTATPPDVIVETLTTLEAP